MHAQVFYDGPRPFLDTHVEFSYVLGLPESYCFVCVHVPNTLAIAHTFTVRSESVCTCHSYETVVFHAGALVFATGKGHCDYTLS